jgi:hypothetical protein
LAIGDDSEKDDHVLFISPVELVNIDDLDVGYVVIYNLLVPRSVLKVSISSFIQADKIAETTVCIGRVELTLNICLADRNRLDVWELNLKYPVCR